MTVHATLDRARDPGGRWRRSREWAQRKRAAKAAAGFDFPGLLAALCVAQRNAPPRDVAPGAPPADRGRWYMEPAKVFDDVYRVGTKGRSSWVLTTGDGLILIDTTYEYETEPVIVGGLRKLGFDPASVKYVIISHPIRARSAAQNCSRTATAPISSWARAVGT